MAIFNGFNVLDSIGSAVQDIGSVASSVGSVTSGLNRAVSGIVDSGGLIDGVTRGTKIGNRLQKAKSKVNQIDQIINGGAGALDDIGSATRMIGNALQGVFGGASPEGKTIREAVAADDISARSGSKQPGDWRVSLEVPAPIDGGQVLRPLNGRMIFPFNPVILLSHSANYSQISPTHTNYPFYAYQNSQVQEITITGEFYVETAQDASYWVACVHFLRTMTKMFYGEGDLQGNPPLVTRLNGYGKHVLNNIPVLLTTFSIDMPADVDYIPTEINGEINYVPTQSQISVSCAPNYARRTHSKFNLKQFADGNFVGGREGFV